MKLEEIFTFENLYDAYKGCRKSKQHKGEVIRFEVNLSSNITKLMDEIITKKYKLGKYKEFLIYEPKERVIEALPFRDRVVIKCFCDVALKNKIDRKLIYDNAACRKEKGTTFAIRRLEKFLRNEYSKERNNKIYFLKCDIRIYLNQKTQIGIVKNGIDFLGYRHILNENGSITRKLRVSSKQRLKKHLKTLHKLREKGIVDDEYVYIRKNAFYNHIKDTKESKKLKDATFPKKV